MKKEIKEIQAKSLDVLVKEEKSLRMEIAKMSVDLMANPQKDTNALVKMKKKLAVILSTIARMQK